MPFVEYKCYFKFRERTHDSIVKTRGDLVEYGFWVDRNQNIVDYPKGIYYIPPHQIEHIEKIKY